MNWLQDRVVTKYFVESLRNENFDLEQIYIKRGEDTSKNIVYVQYWCNDATVIRGFDTDGDEIFYSHYCDLSDDKLEELARCRSYIGEDEIFDLLDLSI